MFSIAKACRRFTDDVSITEDPAAILSSDALILPGVGSFGAGMEGLKVRGLISAVKEFAASGKPMLGICLGAQLMLDKGFEFGEFDGLGLVPGNVVKFPELEPGTKMPHIGWNTVSFPDVAKTENRLFRSTGENPSVYFVHSYIFQPNDRNLILALTDYGGHTFCSAFQRGKIFGCQFHPEKSGEVGLQIIKNFVNEVIPNPLS